MQATGFKRRDVLRAVAAGAAVYGTVGHAQGSWPTKPVTMIVPFPAGGGTDAFARPMAAQFTKLSGKSLDDLRRLPFTTKEDLRNNYPLGYLAIPRREVARFHGSSGSTGRPTFVAYSKSDMNNWADLCARWRDSLKACAPALTVRRNYPYAGKGDGLTAWFRRHLPPDAYVGIELEINQKHVLTPSRRWTALRQVIVDSLRRALASCREGVAE